MNIYNGNPIGLIGSREVKHNDSNVGDILDNTVMDSVISDKWFETKTYVVGEYCIHNNILWKCKVQNVGQEPSEGTFWTQKSVCGELKDNREWKTHIRGQVIRNYVDLPTDWNEICVDVMYTDNQANYYQFHLIKPYVNGSEFCFTNGYDTGGSGLTYAQLWIKGNQIKTKTVVNGTEKTQTASYVYYR